MQLFGQVGAGYNPIANAAYGNNSTPFRQGGQGDLIVSEFGARYSEATYRGQKMQGSLTSGIVTTASLAAGAITSGFLYNPIGSSRNLHVTKVSAQFDVVFAAAAAVGIAVGGFATGLVTFALAGNPGQSSLILPSTPASQGRVLLSATTTAASLVHTWIGEAIASATVPFNETIDLEGGLILTPGCWAFIYTTSASGTASLFNSWEWLELPQ